MKKSRSSSVKDKKINRLDVQNVQKSFAQKEAVRDISFSVNGGEVFGLLGPNGAGKTTLMHDHEHSAPEKREHFI